MKDKINELALELNQFLASTNELSSDDKADINHEIHAVNVQIARPEPKFTIINKSLQIIEAMLVNIASSEYTPIVLQKIQALIALLSQA